MEEKDRLELIQTLIERSDALRSSYSNRAALVLSADALIVATAAFLLEKVQNNHPYKILIAVLVIAALLLMFVSFELALKASASFAKSSSDEAGIERGQRIFFNTTDTLSIFEGLESFKEGVWATDYKQLINYGCAELWVAYVLQRNRYDKVKKSMKWLRRAILLLIFAVCIAFLFSGNPPPNNSFSTPPQ